MRDKKANIFKVRYLHGTHERICGRHKREGECVLPGGDLRIRRRLRLILWRQWKRPWTRFKNLMKHGIPEERAAMSAFNKRGPWFNSGAPHMNQALPKKFFDNMKLVSILERLRWNRITSTQGTAGCGNVRTVV